ncbi:MAG: hypothetical protein ACM3ZQ_05610 [Bacillota bacterium]
MIAIDAASLMDLFLKEDLVMPRARIEAFLLVALGIKPLSLITVPGELADGRELGQAIDDRYRKAVANGQEGNLLQKLSFRFHSLTEKPLAFKQRLIREAYEDIVEPSASYRAHLRWAKQLGLSVYDWEVRPSIHELYFYKSPTVGEELRELMAERQRLKREAWSKVTRDTPISMLVYPEEQSAPYLERLGRLLGYPDCCVQAYLSDRAQGENVEARAARDLHLATTVSGSPEPWAYFVKDLFPCSPTCANGTQVGKEALAALHALSPQLADVYRQLLQENQEMVRVYPVIINQHVQEMERSSYEPAAHRPQPSEINAGEKP